MQLRFALSEPPDASAPYPRSLIATLRGLGHSVSAATLGSSSPAAQSAAGATLAELGGDECLIIDGPCLGAFEPFANQLAERDVMALVRGPAGLEPAVLRSMRRVVVTTGAMQRLLASDHAMAVERLRLVETGVPDAVRSTAPMSDAGCRILMMDVATPPGEPAVVLRALARLPDLDWTLAIVTGGHAPALQTLADELGIGARVVVATHRGADDLERTWQSSGLLTVAMPDADDGALVAEALRRGVPVAIATGSAAPGYVPSVAGAWATRGDDVALANAMRRIIFDAALRQSMSNAAWTLGQHLPSWEAQARRFVAALED